uniref:B-ZIP transcription factor n=1 Tax=Siphoviridae sp. ctWT735 TaxID=2825538 RepID=A0A8S5TUG7_9CAUD|nr:MAG TPA: B-ZIP transcription factor [Siphoviridae sp. ctWT735]DAT98680.1 MAG TPA: B-ZIP transcription factor [Caudoviricetes sp.]
MSITNDNCGFDDGLWLFAILALFGFGGNGMFGNGNRVGEAYATQADIQRAVDLNSIQKGQSEIERAITSATSGIVGAVKDGNYNMLGEIRDIQTEVNRGFTNMQNCCCEIKQGIMENRYLSERNTKDIVSAIREEGNATRNMLMQQENARLRDDLMAARSELGDMRQSNYLLSQAGRWVGNPPCQMPCSCNN